MEQDMSGGGGGGGSRNNHWRKEEEAGNDDDDESYLVRAKLGRVHCQSHRIGQTMVRHGFYTNWQHSSLVGEHPKGSLRRQGWHSAERMRPKK